jgi:hypothetical protein
MTEIEKKEQEKEKKETPKIKRSLDKLLILILVILVAIFLGKYLTQETSQKIPSEYQTSEEGPGLKIVDERLFQGRELNIKVIHHENCEDCFNMNSVFAELTKKGSNLLIEEDYYETSEEFKKLADELGITKMPAAVISGEIEGIEKIIPISERKGDYLVIEAPQPPFYYKPTKKIIGYVDVIYLKDPECLICPQIGQLVLDMELQMGVAFTTKTAYYPNMTEFHELAEKYQITKVPTFIFKGDLLEYENIKKYWERVGTIESDEALVLRLINPPYLNPQTGEIEGIVDITLIAKKEESFDSLALIAEDLQKRFGVVYGKSKALLLDSDEGKILSEQIGIEGSLIILSENSILYPGIASYVDEKIAKITKDKLIVINADDFIY